MLPPDSNPCHKLSKFQYAFDILGNRFPEGSELIAMSIISVQVASNTDVPSSCENLQSELISTIARWKRGADRMGKKALSTRDKQARREVTYT